MTRVANFAMTGAGRVPVRRGLEGVTVARRMALSVFVFLVVAGVGLWVGLLLPSRLPPAATAPGSEEADARGEHPTTPPALLGRAEPPAAAREPGKPVPISVPALDPTRTRSRSLRVRVEGDLAPDDAIEVKVLDLHANRVAAAEVKRSREVVFPPLAWGDYAIRARAGTLMGEARAVWDGVTVVTLAAGRRLRGRTTHLEGEPLADVTVHLHPEYLFTWVVEPEEPTTPPLAVTDEQGRFEVLVPRRANGRPAWLACRHPRYGGMLHAVPDGAGPADVIVQLGPRAADIVPIHVVDESGRDVVPRLRWSVRSELGISPTVSSARFELAWPGGRRPAQLLVDAVGYESVTVDRPPDPARELRVVLPRARWTRIRVRDAAGAGVPAAETSLLALERGEVQWRDAVRTDQVGDAYMKAPAFPHTVLVQSPGLTPVFTALDEGQETVDVRLEEDRPPIFVLPDGLRGSVDVTLESPEGVLLWERQFDLGAAETALPGLPRGLKTATVWMWGRQFRQELTFDAEARVEIPIPADWPGTAAVEVDIDGGGELDGVRAQVNERAASKRRVSNPRIEGTVARCTVLRGRSYEIQIPTIDDALLYPFDVGTHEEEVVLRWGLPDTVPTLAIWSPRIVDEIRGDTVSGGFLEVHRVVDALGTHRARRTSAIDEGKAHVHLAQGQRERARVVVPGYAPLVVGPMLGDELLEVETLRLTRPLKLRLTWPAEERLRVFAFDVRDLAEPSAMNLSPRTGKGGSLEIHGGQSTTHAIWAVGDRWARPRTLEPGTEHAELTLESPGAIEVRLPEALEGAEPARIWIEYQDVNVGYSPRGQWRVLPYAHVVATPGERRDGRYVASVPRCPAGACTVVVAVGDVRLLEQDVVVSAGERLLLEAN